jgi:hypothetical protein
MFLGVHSPKLVLIPWFHALVAKEEDVLAINGTNISAQAAHNNFQFRARWACHGHIILLNTKCTGTCGLMALVSADHPRTCGSI